jgi:hypothetical protein
MAGGFEPGVQRFTVEGFVRIGSVRTAVSMAVPPGVWPAIRLCSGP